MSKCSVCGKELSNEVSLVSGMGPCCRAGGVKVGESREEDSKKENNKQKKERVKRITAKTREEFLANTEDWRELSYAIFNDKSHEFQFKRILNFLINHNIVKEKEVSDKEYYYNILIYKNQLLGAYNEYDQLKYNEVLFNEAHSQAVTKYLTKKRLIEDVYEYRNNSMNLNPITDPYQSEDYPEKLTKSEVNKIIEFIKKWRADLKSHEELYNEEAAYQEIYDKYVRKDEE